MLNQFAIPQGHPRIKTWAGQDGGTCHHGIGQKCGALMFCCCYPEQAVENKLWSYRWFQTPSRLCEVIALVYVPFNYKYSDAKSIYIGHPFTENSAGKNLRSVVTSISDNISSGWRYTFVMFRENAYICPDTQYYIQVHGKWSHVIVPWACSWD